MSAVSRSAPAKINLVLSVGPPAPADSTHPGWHAIASWMVAIDLCDEVVATPLPEGSSSTLDIAFAPDAPRPEPIGWRRDQDLAWRALRALEGHVGRALPTRLEIAKRIPTGAGLGGGSSDCAATLMAVSRAHGLGLDAPTLARLSRPLGSDVAFFIDEHPADCGAPRPALVGGFGDHIERLGACRAELVLIVPPFFCATPDVYRAFDRLSPGPLREHEVRRLIGAGALDPEALFNDLEAAACGVAPELARLLAHARSVSGFPVHVTGSGSAMFILTPPERAYALARRLTDDPLLGRCAILATHTTPTQSAP